MCAAERGALHFHHDLNGDGLGKSKVIVMVARAGQTTETPLAKRLREVADSGRHERALELYARANELDGIDANTSIPLIVAYWARARRLLCDITGEDLI